MSERPRLGTVLARVRMCLSEVGIDPMRAYADRGTLKVRGVDVGTAWRAYEIATAGILEEGPMCRACYTRVCLDEHDVIRSARIACVAEHPLLPDCGLSSTM